MPETQSLSIANALLLCAFHAKSIAVIQGEVLILFQTLHKTNSYKTQVQMVERNHYSFSKELLDIVFCWKAH